MLLENTNCLFHSQNPVLLHHARMGQVKVNTEGNMLNRQQLTGRHKKINPNKAKATQAAILSGV